MKSRYLIYSGLVLLTFVLPVIASGSQSKQADPGALVRNSIAKLNREASSPDGASLVSELIGSEYGTPTSELEWAAAHQLPWGEIAAFAYVRATTGRTFAELADSNIRADILGYAESVGMNSSKMVHSLDQFLKRTEKERNSRIFEQLRTTGRVSSIPDLGSGFGLFQQALDFRNIEVLSVTKTHTVGTGTVKGQ